MSTEVNTKKIVKGRRFGEIFIIQVCTLVTILATFFVVHLFPGQVRWVKFPELLENGLVIALIFQLVILFFTEVLGRDYLYRYTVYFWILFHTFFIYVTGGIESSFIFTYLFIPINSLFLLDYREIRRHGIVAGFLLLMLFFTDSSYWSDPSAYTKQFVNEAGFVILLWLIVRFMKYTMSQRVNGEQLKRKLSELEELNYTKQVFLTAMSHQLRTPLNGAKWAVEAVLNDKTCSEPELLEEGRNRIDNAIGIISKILKTAELDVEKESIKVKQEDVDLKIMIDQILLEQDYLIKIKGIKLQYENYQSVAVKGDEKMLRLAFINIIDNAFRYSPKGIVQLNLFNSNKEAVFTIQDNGIGIDSKDLEFITIQKFYRGKNAMTVDPNESGVGLYVTRKIIEIHGGRIAISSTLGQGTKVSVALPLTPSI